MSPGHASASASDVASRSPHRHTVADCHVHLIDPERAAFAPGPSYRPKPHERADLAALLGALDAHGVHYATLVQPSWYGEDPTLLMLALRAAPSRLRGVSVLPMHDAALFAEHMAMQRAHGVVGLRLNLLHRAIDDVFAGSCVRCLQAAAEGGWLIQITGRLAAIERIANDLILSGATIVLDHLALPDLDNETPKLAGSGLVALAATGRCTLKVSGPYRVHGASEARLVRWVARLGEIFGQDRMIWGSDFPFANAPVAHTYAQQRTLGERLLAAAGLDIAKASENARGLFGFAAVSTSL